MKWHIMRYFTRVCTLCNNESNLQGQKYILFMESLTSNLLKYKQDSSILSVPLEHKGFIKETAAFTKAIHYDHSYYHTAFSLSTYLPTEHMWKHRPKLAVHQEFGSHSPSPLEESNNRLLLFLFSSCFIWISLSVCVILLLYPLDAIKLYVVYVCGILVRHVFCKAVLVFVSFLQNKTSGLVAHENSTF